MEELRLQGNAFVASGEPHKAVPLYIQAMDLYDDVTASGINKTLDEYTKSAGNALTCLLKMQDRAACIKVAKRALQVNSIFGKANAAWGRCLMEDASLYGAGEGPHTAFMLLCRAVYELPALEESSRPFLAAAIGQMLEDKRRATASGSLEDALAVRKGSCGFGVVAQMDIPPFAEVSSTLGPFSVSAYEETEGRGCCVSCGCVLHEATRPSVLPCPTCNMVFYCSPSCLESHASAHAQYECTPLMKLKVMAANVGAQHLDVPEEFFETAFHCITTFSGIRAGKEGHEQIFTLEAHTDEVAQRFPMVPLVRDLLPNETCDAIAKVVGIIRCNALEICDATGLGVGQSLFVGKGNITSFFNHSCAPNCAIDADRNCICTVRRVYKGEELTIAYMPQLYWPAKLRQDALAERYFFSCRCERCEGSATDPFVKAIVAVQTGSRQDATKHYHAQCRRLARRCAAVGPTT
ncbi:SET and MYND domain-containing protein [Strigomonas culicis]|uniref:SET and MYND domain-containing protein n=1 Tax=Strigomonas culicis TaxID=28005 RepID=S9TPF5_9TRYP|nr:SET and MYND domain-containing protein [Strigomonas culicis]|eukprot:EPY18554.1 SET and MYND domain-containing protein [Strigomonas culicis]